MADFVDEYIDECMKNGLTKIPDIIKHVVQKRDDLDVEIKKIYSLKEERDNLQKVLKTLGYEEVKRGRKARTPMVSEAEDTQNSDLFNSLLLDICEVIGEASGPMTSREIITEVGYDGGDPTPIYSGLQWLIEKKIFERVERNFVKGSEWDSRDNLFASN